VIKDIQFELSQQYLSEYSQQTFEKNREMLKLHRPLFFNCQDRRKHPNLTLQV